MVHTTDLGAVISQVQTDGSLTTVMDDANIAGVYDLIEFAGSIYFIGGTASGDWIYKCNADGSATAIAQPVGATLSNQFANMSVSAGRLYFIGRTLIDDGFGGTQNVPAYYSVNAAGKVKLVLEGSNDQFNLIALDSYSFGFDPADPVLAPAAPIR